MRLTRDRQQWSEQAFLSFTLLFDGVETHVFPVVYSEKPTMNDSIDSYLITFPDNITRLYPGDEFSLTDSTILPRKLVYSRRHASQSPSIVGMNAKSGIVKIDKVKCDTVDMIYGLEGHFTALLADSTKITNGYFNAHIDINH